MTIENSTLRRVGMDVLLLAVASGLSYGIWKGREVYMANYARIAALESSVASGEKALADKTAEAESLESELARTNEKYGVAVSEKSAAESAKAKADAAKAKAEGDAASANQKATAASNEAAWQRGQAAIANGNLAVCSNNEDALTNVAYNINKQKEYLAKSALYVAEAGKQFIWENWDAGSDAMDSALYYSELAKNLQPTVDYWLGQIE